MEELGVPAGTITKIREFIQRTVPDAARYLADALTRVGLDARLDDGSLTPAAREKIAYRVVQHLMASDCSGHVSFRHDRDIFKTSNLDECSSLSNRRIEQVGGYQVIREAEKAYDHLVNRCRDHAIVKVTISGLDAPLEVECFTELAPRPPYLAIGPNARVPGPTSEARP